MRIQSLLPAAFLFVVISASTNAQTRLITIDGERVDDVMGRRCGFHVDHDQDGLKDLFLTALSGGCNDGEHPGTVSCISSGSHVELTRWCGEWEDPRYPEGFGADVCASPDYDGDGQLDFVISAPRYHHPYYGNNTGRITCFSSQSGTVLWIREGDLGEIAFGTSVAFVDDIDGDAVRDLVVGAPGYGGSGEGGVLVYSGASRTYLRGHIGEAPYFVLGTIVREIVDADGDGSSDYAATLGGVDDQGAVFLYSGRTGKLVREWRGEVTQYLGIALADAGDVDGDGLGDLLIGAGNPPPGSKYRSAYVYSGGTGSMLFALTSPQTRDYFGYAVASVGDMNGDGTTEFLIGALDDDEAGHDAGAAYLFSGKTQRVLYKYFGDYPDSFAGSQVAGGVDCNGDRIPDIVLAMPTGYDPIPGGRVVVWSGNDLFLQASALTVTEGDTLVLDTRGGPEGALALLVLRAIDGSDTFVPLVWSSLDSNGESSFSSIIPPGLSGHSFSFQSFAQRLTGRGVTDSERETVTVQ